MADGFPSAARCESRCRENSGVVSGVKLLRVATAPIDELESLRLPSPSWRAGITATPVLSERRQSVAVRSVAKQIEVLIWNHFPSWQRIQPLSGSSKDKVKRQFPYPSCSEHFFCATQSAQFVFKCADCPHDPSAHILTIDKTQQVDQRIRETHTLQDISGSDGQDELERLSGFWFHGC